MVVLFVVFVIHQMKLSLIMMEIYMIQLLLGLNVG